MLIMAKVVKSFKRYFSFSSSMLQTKESNFSVNKNWVARLMDVDADKFSEKDLEDAIKYLLPSGLFDRTARPILKDESYYNKYKNFEEKKFDINNFPPTLYLSQAPYHDLIFKMYNLEKLASKDNIKIFHKKLEEKENAFHYKWKTKNEFEKYFGKSIKITDGQYKFIINKLISLSIYQRNNEVYKFLQDFIIPMPVAVDNYKKLPIDSQGIVHAIGYRKSSTADIQLRLGSGIITVNECPLDEYFNDFITSSKVLMPFQVIGKLHLYDVDAQVISGGSTSQADAIRLAISIALPSFSDDYVIPLSSAGLLKRDPRHSERKKFGQEGARKKYTWVAR